MASSAGKIAVIDYGMGNLRSVWQALVHVADGREIVVTADPEVVAGAGRVVFPGQGAMPDCMRELDARGLRSVVIEAARTKPFLGICIVSAQATPSFGRGRGGHRVMALERL